MVFRSGHFVDDAGHHADGDELLLQVDVVDDGVERQDGAHGHGLQEVELVQLEKARRGFGVDRGGDEGDVQALADEGASINAVVEVLVLDVADGGGLETTGRHRLPIREKWGRRR